MDVVKDSLCELERDLADLKADLIANYPSDGKAAAVIEWIEQGEQHIREWKAMHGGRAE